MEVNKVRQVLINYEKSNFRLDVNQNVKISDLKRIIETAFQIPRNKIRIFHQNKEIIQTDDSRVENVFPNLQSIELTIVLGNDNSNETREKEFAFKLRLGEYCDRHNYKYPCHYCFDCNKSFCSICNLENLHAEHETIEKYDYLQDSSIIVNRIFEKSTESVKILKPVDQEKVLTFEKYLKENLFDRLRESISNIELKFKEILKVYLESSKNSLKQVNTNLIQIKEQCIENLDQTKRDLQFQNMLIDESVITSFYKTILATFNQKKIIESDKDQYHELLNSLDLVKPVAETLFNEIKKYLTEKLTVDSYHKCHQEILKKKIEPVDINKLKENLGKYLVNTVKKNMVSGSKSKIIPQSPAQSSVWQSTKKKFHHLEHPYEEDEAEAPLLNQASNGNIVENKYSYSIHTTITENKFNNYKQIEKNAENNNPDKISNSIKNTGNSLIEEY